MFRTEGCCVSDVKRVQKGKNILGARLKNVKERYVEFVKMRKEELKGVYLKVK